MSARIAFVFGAAGLLLACGQPEESMSVEPETVEAATLYRNSTLDAALRIHWATFDASEPDASYNIRNCQMAARLLNANYLETGGSEDDGVGFWCEPGTFTPDGPQHSNFDAEYPTR